MFRSGQFSRIDADPFRNAESYTIIIAAAIGKLNVGEEGAA
jgi:hypothetical protein